MDDNAGLEIARARSFAATGTVGLLDLGARRQVFKLEEACARFGRQQILVARGESWMQFLAQAAQPSKG
jgi:hypothetical protein